MAKRHSAVLDRIIPAVSAGSRVAPEQISLVLEPTNWALLRAAVIGGGYTQPEVPGIAAAAGFVGTDSTARAHALQLSRRGILDKQEGRPIQYLPNLVSRQLYAHLAALLRDPPGEDEVRLAVVLRVGPDLDVVASSLSGDHDVATALLARVVDQITFTGAVEPRRR